MTTMTDTITMALILGMLYAGAAAADWLAEHAPWVGWIGAAALVFAGMKYLYRRGWGKEGDDNASL